MEREEIIPARFVDDVDGHAYFDQARQEAIDQLRTSRGFLLITIPEKAEGDIGARQMVCSYGPDEDVAMLYLAAYQTVIDDVRKLSEGL